MRTPTENNPRQAALINNINEQNAEKNVSILFLSLGTAGRKNLIEKFPQINAVATAPLNEIKDKCEDTFRKPRNRTLDRFKFI